MNQFEQDVRQMLIRRAADMDGPGPESHTVQQACPSSSGDGREQDQSGSRRVLVASVALVAAVVLGALALSNSGNGLGTAATEDPSADTQTTNTTATATTVEETETTSTGERERDVALRLSDLSGLLPESADLRYGLPVFDGGFEPGPEGIGRSYLSDRLALQNPALQTLETDGSLTLLRWHAGPEAPDGSGFLVVRESRFRPGVVAALSEGIDLSGLERSVAGVSGQVTTDPANTLAVDLVSLGPPGSAIDTEATGADGRLEIDEPAGSVPVAVRAIASDGNSEAVAEVVLNVVGFETPCGDVPPIAVEVGNVLGAREISEPSDLSPRAVLENQGTWSHIGDGTRVDIRWPADPAIASVRDVDVIEDYRSTSMRMEWPLVQSGLGGIDLKEVVLFVDSDLTNPCSMVQFDIYGSPGTTDQWANALSGQWSFRLPLDLASVELIDESTPSEPPVDELVVGTATAEGPPVVATTGSCDGLPDAPPREGGGNRAAGETPEAALANFVNQSPPLDPPMPTAGFLKVTIDENTVAYVYGEDKPTVVIDLARTNSGQWTVQGWMAAAC